MFKGTKDMTAILSLKPTTKYVRASELVNLESCLDRTFVVRKNGEVKAFKLVEVKRGSVLLGYCDGRLDTFGLSLNKFLKYYELEAK